MKGDAKKRGEKQVGRLLLPSSYVVEPKSLVQGWSNHWNYKWRGRNSLYGVSLGKVKFRYEGGGIYIVQDESGAIWKLTKEEMEELGLSKNL